MSLARARARKLKKQAKTGDKLSKNGLARADRAIGLSYVQQYRLEEKYRKEQEKKAQGEQSIDVNGYMGQAKSMMNSAQSSVKVPNVSVPQPHF
jgi:hypothetical protein